MSDKITIAYEKVFEYGAQNEVHEMTRPEAINLMADAISDAAKRSCNKEFVAEAALNALLERE